MKMFGVLLTYDTCPFDLIMYNTLVSWATGRQVKFVEEYSSLGDWCTVSAHEICGNNRFTRRQLCRWTVQRQLYECGRPTENEYMRQPSFFVCMSLFHCQLQYGNELCPLLTKHVYSWQTLTNWNVEGIIFVVGMFMWPWSTCVIHGLAFVGGHRAADGGCQLVIV